MFIFNLWISEHIITHVHITYQMTSDDKSDNDDDNKDDDDGEDVDDDAILPMTLWKTALIWSVFQTRESNWFLATPTNSQIPSLGFDH